VNGAPSPAQKGSPVKAQQPVGAVQKAQLKSSGSIGGGGSNGAAASPGDTVLQLVTQARATAQQQRWQQLQQQLKGQSVAGGGVLAEQLEAQEQMTQVQVRGQQLLRFSCCSAGTVGMARLTLSKHGEQQHDKKQHDNLRMLQYVCVLSWGHGSSRRYNGY
jgi:hypothetical protein